MYFSGKTFSIQGGVLTFTNMSKSIVYVGFNDFYIYKRGVENVILSQCLALPLEYKVFYFFCSNNKRWVRYKYSHEGREIICFGIPILVNFFIPLFICLLKLREKKLFVHSHSAVITALIPFKTDCLTVHDGLSYSRKYNGPKINLIYKLVEYISYKKSNKIHYISKFTKLNMIRTSSEMFMIYNTTPLELLKKKHVFVKPIQFKEVKGKIFLSVRGIQERTRIDLLIEYARTLKENGGNDKIFIAGKGPLLEKYRQLIFRDDLCEYIEMLGFVSDEELLDYYYYSDAVIVTAEHGEGFGLPIIEGYLFNKPVFASNVCAMPEVIFSKDFLFSNDVDSLSYVISRFYNENMSFDYEDYYKKNFSHTAVLSSYRVYLY